MRQFLIKKQNNAPLQNENTIALSVNATILPDMRLIKGTNIVRIPFALETVNPADKHALAFQFKIPKELAQHGIMLLGAYEDGEEIAVSVFNLNDTEIRMRDRQDFLLIEVVEKVSLKAVSEFNLNADVKLASAPKRKLAKKPHNGPTR